MSLDSVRILRSLAMSMISGDVIETRSSYEQSTTAGLGMLVMQLSGQLEVATEWLVEENATLRAILRSAAAIVADPALAERVATAGHGFDEGLRFSVLREGNELLRGLLVELHAHIEELESAAALELDDAIWVELHRSVQRRARV